MKIKPRRQTIIPPEGGWEPHTLYLVEISFRPGNPIHRSTLYTGFLNGPDGEPGGYHEIHKPGMDERNQMYEMYYLKAIRPILNGDDLTKDFIVMPPEPPPRKKPKMTLKRCEPFTLWINPPICQLMEPLWPPPSPNHTPISVYTIPSCKYVGWFMKKQSHAFMYVQWFVENIEYDMEQDRCKI